MKISVKQFFITFLLIGGSVSSTWLVLNNNNANIVSASADQPDSIMTDISVTRTNEQTGKIQDQLHADSMVHFTENNKTDIMKPKFTVYQDTDIPWILTANRGTALDGTDILQLWDNVVLTQAAGPQNQPTTITTSSVIIYPKKQYADTDQFVKGQQPNANMTAKGMHVDFKTSIVTLRSQVRGVYQKPGVTSSP